MNEIRNFLEEENLKGAVKYISETKRLELSIDSDDGDDITAVKDIVTGFLEYALSELASKKQDVKENGENVVNIGDYISFILSYREGDVDESFQLSAVPGSEAKKLIKINSDDEE